MKPLVTFGDPDTLMRDYLRPLLLARSESYAPNTVTANFPANLSNATHLQVELEAGSAEDYPVTERSQVRFTVWAPFARGVGHTVGGASDAKDAASLVMGLVYATEGVAGIAGTRILGGRSDVTKDPDTGYLMCWFLARVNLKATVLAS